MKTTCLIGLKRGKDIHWNVILNRNQSRSIYSGFGYSHYLIEVRHFHRRIFFALICCFPMWAYRASNKINNFGVLLRFTFSYFGLNMTFSILLCSISGSWYFSSKRLFCSTSCILNLPKINFFPCYCFSLTWYLRLMWVSRFLGNFRRRHFSRAQGNEPRFVFRSGLVPTFLFQLFTNLLSVSSFLAIGLISSFFQKILFQKNICVFDVALNK